VPVNLVYQVTAKPTELLAPLGDWLIKTPAETWHDYAPLFRRNATAAITPELLAALAQVESAGNPLATTYWHWRFSVNPLAIYRPASSAVGMFQMTDGTFADARRYCIRDHRLAEDSADDAVGLCGMSGAYTRIFPSDAVELTAADLDRKVTELTAKRKIAALTQQQRDNLAAMIHLCGSGPADEYLRHGFRLAPGKHCGDQDVAAYLARVGALKRQFVELAQAGEP
jgi:transglycosylase-like protein with SLT domain